MDTKDAEEGSKVEDAAGNSVADEAHLAPSDWTTGIIDNFFDKMFVFFYIYPVRIFAGVVVKENCNENYLRRNYTLKREVLTRVSQT